MVIPRDMTARLDPKESVEQPRTEVFNPAENHALEVYTLNRLTQCLDRVVERGDLLAKGAEYGYGRIFYYTLWGYGFNAVQERTAGQFRDIINDYWLLRDHFLTAVDYVSNSLKAKFASNALGRQIDIIPAERIRKCCPAARDGFVKPIFTRDSGRSGRDQYQLRSMR